MRLTELLRELQRRDIRLFVEDGRLRCKAPRDALSADLRSAIDRYNKELREVLTPKRRQYPPIRPIERGGAFPLSFAQERLWFLSQLDAESVVYNIPSALRLTGELDVCALEQSFNELVRRHEILRTTYQLENDRPVQHIQDEWTLCLPIQDLRDLKEPDSVDIAQRIAVEEARAPFDLTTGPMLRIRLLVLPPRSGAPEHVLVLVFHHIVTDDWSTAIFFKELATIYTAFAAGLPSPLPSPALQYADFAVAQREWMQGPILEEHLSYWRSKLADNRPTLNLPARRGQRATPSNAGGEFAFDVAPRLREGLRRLGQRLGVTQFVIFLASFFALLYRYTGQQDISIGTTIANRNWLDTEALTGFFVNTLVLRADLSGDAGVDDLLAQLRTITLDAQSHQDLPFERLVEALRPHERNAEQAALFQVMFTFHNVNFETLSIPGLAVESIGTIKRNAVFDLVLHVAENDDELGGWIEYRPDRFDPETIAGMARHYLMALEGIVEAPTQRLSELRLLPPSERQRVLVDFNETAVGPGWEFCLHELFEAQAARTAEAVAVVFDDERFSYAELDRRANQIARDLLACGVRVETKVGVCAERSFEMVAALLAILKAGGAYLPLDPDFPKERLAYIIDDAEPLIVLTQERLRERLPDGVRTLSLDADAHSLSGESSERLDVGVRPSNLAYVLYTSGSTGAPKGVELTHAGVVRRLEWMQDRFGLSAEDCVLQKTPYTFDVSVWEFFWPLLAGARLVLAPPGDHRDPKRLSEIIEREGVTTLHFVPSMLQAFLDCPDLPRLESVRRVLCGGETLTADIRDRFHAALSAELHHLYGPTETSIDVTAYACGRGVDETRIPIGRPLWNTQIYLLDEQYDPAPIGVAGELYVGGAGLARGYLGRPALTAERFLPNPFGGSGERLYRTGDLARYRADGNIEFLGRIDHQVKVRGFRIELGEIEAALVRLSAVREAAVLAREDLSAEKQIVAYLVGATGADLEPADLRTALRRSLPEYMIPAAFVTLDALPLTTSGKVDRKALPAPDIDTQIARSYAAPRNPTEETLCRIWAELLGLERVGIADSFFELGGHSLLATQVVSRIRRTFSVDLRLRSLFEQPTIAALAPLIEAAREKSEDREAPLVRAARDRTLPLSFAQQRLWFLEEFRPGDLSYVVPAALRLIGALDISALSWSINEIVSRHEALRTTIASVDGEATQRIAPSLEIACPLVDLSDLDAALREDEMRRRVAEENRHPFDLARGPLLRVLVFDMGVGEATLAREHVVAFSLHHIVSDGWSMDVLMREFAALYEARIGGDPSPLEPLVIQYADYAVWQRDWLRGEVLERQLSYWRRALAGAPPALALPTDRPRPSVQDNTGAAYRFEIPAEISDQLRTLAHLQGATLFMVLLAAFHVLLSRYSGQKDICIGAPAANRRRIELEGLIGFFVNTLVLRAELDGDPSFVEFLSRVREAVVGAQEHQDLPFERLVEELRPARDTSRESLFQAMFTLRNARAQAFSLPGLRIEILETTIETSKFDLTLQLEETDEGLRASIEYATALFDAATIDRMAAHYRMLLSEIVVDPLLRIGSLPMVTTSERSSLLYELNDTASQFGRETCLHELFEAQARSTPNSVAVVFGSERLSYAELDARADRLARRLVALGVGPETIVGLCVERSLEMVVGLLGVLKAGGAYLPLDPDQPSARLAFMIADAAPRLVLTEERLAGRLPATIPILSLDLNRDETSAKSVEALGRRAAPQNLAYVIYTSGSTGAPKGVAVSHSAIVNHMEWMRQLVAIDARDRVLQKTTFNFDASIWEFWLPLIVGARCVLASAEAGRDPEELWRQVSLHGVTVLQCVPSFFRALLEQVDPEALRSLRYLFCGGEALPPALIERMLRQWNGELWNLYGPTEAAIDSAAWRCRPVVAGSAAPIGRPISNVQIYILDTNLEPVPAGVAGELYIGGAGLARGYLGRPDLTAERFIADPFGAAGERLYRSGDLARRLSDGNVEFLGRIDRQVKIRGFRIEMGEIEACLATHSNIRQAAVLARQSADGAHRLVAYVVPGAEPLDAGELRGHIRARLPEYMIPAIVSIDALPLSANGKIDLGALPPLDLEAGSGERFVAPRNTTEEILAETWAAVLHIPRIGIEDNFFELGGHSLLAVTLVERMRQKGLKTDVRALFMNPTVAGLAAILGSEANLIVPPNRIPAGCDSIIPDMLPLIELTQAEIDRIVSGVPGGAANVQDIYPAAPLQEGILFHHLVAANGDPYLLRSVLEFDTREKLDRFLEAMRAVIARHDILRTAIVWEGTPEPLQVVWRDAPLIVEDAPVVPDDGDILEQVRRLFDPREFRLDVSKAPMMRAFIAFDPANERWLALLLAHHLVSDHVTRDILIEETKAHLLGEDRRLPAPLPFRDYVVQTRAQFRQSDHEAFFQTMLGDVTEPTAPFGLVDIQSDGSTSDEARIDLDPILARRLRDAARRLRVSAASICHFAWAQVLAGFSNRKDVVFGTVLSGRTHGGERADRALGLFINTLPVRIPISQESVEAGVAHTHRLLSELLGHEHAALGLAQRCSAVPAPTPLFSTLLNYRHSFAPAGAGSDLSAAWDGVKVLCSEERTNYPVALSIDDLGEDFRLTAQTQTAIDPTRICASMQATLERLVDALETAPSTPASSVDTLPASERRRLLVEWNETATDYPRDLCIHELFEEQVARAPEAVALVFEDSRLTYAELDARSDRLANYLRGMGVGPDQVVGVCVERSLEMIIALLGVLKAGGAYLPLDGDFPRQRLTHMLDDAKPLLILTQTKLRERFVDDDDDMVLCLDREWPSFGDRRRAHPAGRARPANLAYVSYTSGSTGRPKGVAVVHEGVVRLVKEANYVRFDHPGETFLHFAPLGFDASTFEIWGALLNGARLVIAPPSAQVALDDLGRLVRDHGVTTLWLTAALFHRVVEYRLGDLAGVAQMLTGGDVVSPSHARAYCNAFPESTLINGYGPTENTTFSTFHAASAHSGADVLPIGKPIANSTAYILNSGLDPAPIGVVGELHVGGAGLARGYFGRPDLTAERFVPNPFGDASDRLYKTGDLARYRPDGAIEYLGRIDRQAKIRGFRIELGEIETALCRIPGVREAAVEAHADSRGEKRLVAYVAGDRETELTATSLRASLQKDLPDFMTPSTLIVLEALPLTASGKVDRKALPRPDPESEPPERYVAPRTALEETLCQIFADVLGRDRVGAEDDFFELGGHSLLAFGLAHRIGEVLRCRLPLVAVFQAPSPARLAKFVSQNRDELRRALVVLREGRGGAPLFCIHPAGSVACYVPLARGVGGEFPIYGLESPAILDPDSQKESITAIAAEYAASIRKTSPQGPYRLLGWSMGGLIAHAIAAHLEAQGQEIEFLGLLDVWLEVETPNRGRFDLFARYLDRNPDDRSALASLDADELRDLANATDRLPPKEWFLHVAAYGQKRGKWLKSVPLGALESLFVEWWDGIALTNAHAPRRVNANMWIWWASGSLEGGGCPPVDWRLYTSGETRIDVVAGDHDSIVNDAYVIESIGRCLNAVER
jgi:amino acid adenylation domain-containing protein